MGLQHLRGSVKQPGQWDEQHHVAAEYVVGAELFPSPALLVGLSSPSPRMKGLLSPFLSGGRQGCTSSALAPSVGADSGLSWQVLRNKGVYESVKYIQQENFWIGPSSVRTLTDPWSLVSRSALCFPCPQLRGFSEVLLSSGGQSLTSSLQPAVLGPGPASHWDTWHHMGWSCLPSTGKDRDLCLLPVASPCPC